MSEEKETITQGLGIEDSWFESKVEDVIKSWKTHELVSDALKEIAQDIKDQEFETEIPVTEYEKKLVLAGYMAGQVPGILETAERMSLLEVMASILKRSEGGDEE